MTLDTIESQKWPEDGLERVECCPICGNSDRKLLHAELTDRVFFCAPGKWSLYQCTSCGTGYLDPRPTSDTIALAYKHYFTHNEENNNPKSNFANIKRNLRNGYLNYRYKADIQPAWIIGRWIALLWQRKKNQIDESVRHLPNSNNSGLLVDIGCGNGHFLNTAMELGWEAWGVDIDPKAVEIAQKTGARILQGGFPKTGLPSEHFDIVTLSHVIEHVHDPIAALQEAFRVLKPGGQIWLATPNMDSFGYAHFRENWLALDSPRHLVLFNTISMGMALTKSGFIHVKDKSCPVDTLDTFKFSLRISLGQDPFNANDSNLSITLRLLNNLANFIETIDPSQRENLTITAQKPQSN